MKSPLPQGSCTVGPQGSCWKRLLHAIARNLDPRFSFYPQKFIFFVKALNRHWNLNPFPLIIIYAIISYNTSYRDVGSILIAGFCHNCLRSDWRRDNVKLTRERFAGISLSVRYLHCLPIRIFSSEPVHRFDSSTLCFS